MHKHLSWAKPQWLKINRGKTHSSLSTVRALPKAACRSSWQGFYTAPEASQRRRRPDRGRRSSITVFISVDSELATRTKTSASKQNLSIQLSSCDVTSVPGLQGGGEFRRIKSSFWISVLYSSVCFFNWLCVCVPRCSTCGHKLFTDVSQVHPLTCLRAPNHLAKGHTWTWAKTHGQGSRRPDSHPCGEHEPAGLQSTEDAVTEGFQKCRRLLFVLS